MGFLWQRRPASEYQEPEARRLCHVDEESRRPEARRLCHVDEESRRPEARRLCHVDEESRRPEARRLCHLTVLLMEKSLSRQIDGERQFM